MKAITGLFTSATVITFWLIGIVSMLTSIICDGNSGKFGWLVVDIMLFPIGVVRGALMLLGVI